MDVQPAGPNCFLRDPFNDRVGACMQHESESETVMKVNLPVLFCDEAILKDL